MQKIRLQIGASGSDDSNSKTAIQTFSVLTQGLSYSVSSKTVSISSRTGIWFNANGIYRLSTSQIGIALKL